MSLSQCEMRNAPFLRASITEYRLSMERKFRTEMDNFKIMETLSRKKIERKILKGKLRLFTIAFCCAGKRPAKTSFGIASA